MPFSKALELCEHELYQPHFEIFANSIFRTTNRQIMSTSFKNLKRSKKNLQSAVQMIEFKFSLKYKKFWKGDLLKIEGSSLLF